MTPEERAAAVLYSLGYMVVPQSVQAIAAAIQAAIEAERAACAQLMDDMWADASPGEAIRARSEATQ
jgi:hypothetical protein